MGAFCAPAAADPTNLFATAAPDAATAAGAKAPVGPIARQRTVVLNGAAFSSASIAADGAAARAPVELRIALFPDATAIFKELGSEAAHGGGTIWRGETFDGGATLVLARGQVTGQVSLRGKVYRIAPAGGGAHSVAEVALDRMAPDGPEMIPPRTNRRPTSSPDVVAPQAAAPTTTTIGVFAAYTTRARSASSDILSDINLAISLTNEAYASSRVYIQLKLLGTRVVASYNENQASYEDSLYSLSGFSSGSASAQFDPIRAKRDSTKADLVVLIRRGGSYCGIAWLNEAPDPALDAPYGFSVTSLECIPNLTAGHEFGHNMGLRHDRYVEPSAPNSAINYGFVNVTKRVRDVMSYANRCSDSGVSCMRINKFSNPRIKAGGQPFGVARDQPGAADAALRLNETRNAVSKFRN